MKGECNATVQLIVKELVIQVTLTVNNSLNVAASPGFYGQLTEGVYTADLTLYVSAKGMLAHTATRRRPRRSFAFCKEFHCPSSILRASAKTNVHG